jgi:hypothetical protein
VWQEAILEEYLLGHDESTHVSPETTFQSGRPRPFFQVGRWIPALQAADRSASRLAVARGRISDAAARRRARVRGRHGWLTRHSRAAWTYSGAGRRAADVEASTSLPGRVGSESAPAISTQKGRVNKGSAPHPPPLAVVVHDPKLMSGPSRTPARPSAGRSVQGCFRALP